MVLAKLLEKRSKLTGRYITKSIAQLHQLSTISNLDILNFIKDLNKLTDDVKLNQVLSRVYTNKDIFRNGYQYLVKVIQNEYNNANKNAEIERSIYGTDPPERSHGI